MPELSLVIVGPNPPGAVPLRAEVAFADRTLSFAFVTPPGKGPHAAASEDPHRPGWLYFLPTGGERYSLFNAAGPARVTVIWRRDD